MSYKLSDLVKFRRPNGVGVCRIEDCNIDEDWFEYFEYVTPEELPQGRQPHHGLNEVFKTDQLKRAKLSEIIEKVQLNKLSQYLALEHQGYVMRQEYVNRELRPALKSCICGVFPNPDQALLTCADCEKAFHIDCLQRKVGPINCDQCRAEFNVELLAKRIVEVPIVVPITTVTKVAPAPVIQIEEEEEEMDLKGVNQHIDLDKLVKKHKRNDGHGQKIVQPTQQPDAKETVKIHDETVRTQKQQSYKNISESNLEKMNQWVEKYRLMENNLNSFEKKRQEVREKFFKVIFYGVAELKDLYNNDPKALHPAEVEFIKQSENQLFQSVKNLALDIEVLLHLKFNTQHRGRLETPYVDRCKLVYMHLRDDKNLELRRKVISKEYIPMDLCTRDERDLYNPEKRKQTQEIAMRVIELNQKDLGDQPKNASDGEELNISRQVHAITLSELSALDEAATPSIKKDTSASRGQQLKDRMAEYSLDKSIARFKKRLTDELQERECLPILKNLNEVIISK